jgi:hypothetical protein
MSFADGEKKSTRSHWKVTLASYIATFACGVIVGLRVHKEELESYRSVYETAASHRWRRRCMKAILASGSCLVLLLGVKSVLQSSTQREVMYIGDVAE